MELNVIWKHARTAALECCEGSVYEMEEPCRISLNGVFYKESRQVVNLLQGLEPGKEYHVSVERGEEAAEIMFCTDTQDYTLNVRDFGAKGVAYRTIRHIFRQRSCHARETVVC